MRFIFKDSNFQPKQNFEITSPVNLEMIRDYLKKKEPHSYFCCCKLKIYWMGLPLSDYNDNPEKPISTCYNDLL